MTTQAVLHIGTKKTGTTYLQEFLRVNQQQLREIGWEYPSFLGRRNHLMVAIPFSLNKNTEIHRTMKLTTPEANQAAIEELDAALRDAVKPGQKWIFTSEFFASRLRRPDQIEACLALLRKHFDEIRVVVYFRRPEFMVTSTYSQSVKEGSILPLDLEYVERHPSDYGHLATVNLWTDAVGSANITVRPYLERYRKDSAAILNDFLTAVGIPADADWVEPKRDASNRSLGMEGVQVMRAVNFVFPGPEHYSRARLHQRAAVTRRVQANTTSDPFGLTQELTTALESMFAAQNQQIAARFSPAEANEWLGQPAMPPIAAKDAMTNDRLATILLSLVDENEKVSPAFIAQIVGRLAKPLGIVDWNDPASNPDFEGWRRKVRKLRGRLRRTPSTN